MNNKTISSLLGALALLPLGLAQAAVPTLSTGADGPFQPTTSIKLEMPADGIFNFTTVNIPSGVTVTFNHNVQNTPVYWLATGDVTIAGIVDVSGSNGVNPIQQRPGDNLADVGLGGGNGPGGYRGGPAGNFFSQAGRGGNGAGPGGAKGGANCAGSGGSYATAGQDSVGNDETCEEGALYGQASLQALVGGSGGSGGKGLSAGTTHGGSGGGGGGAILISTPGVVNLLGKIDASGGEGGQSSTTSVRGGSGSGGAIRIVATAIAGSNSSNNTLHAKGGTYSFDGGSGYIRLESEAVNDFANANLAPIPSFGVPQPVFPVNLPRIRISKIADVAVPIVLTGEADVILPTNIANPVAVEVTANNVPVGQTVKVKMTSFVGAVETINSAALAGTFASSTAIAQITLPQGDNRLLATAYFTVDASQAVSFSQFTDGERVASVEVISENGINAWVLVTESGAKHRISAEQVAALN